MYEVQTPSGSVLTKRETKEAAERYAAFAVANAYPQLVIVGPSGRTLIERT